MHSQRASSTFCQHLEIATGLSGFHNSEGVFLFRNRNVVGVVTGQLQEDSAIGAALVGLSGGVQKARAEAEASSHVFVVAHRVTDRRHWPPVRIVHLDVTE